MGIPSIMIYLKKEDNGTYRRVAIFNNNGIEISISEADARYTEILDIIANEILQKIIIEKIDNEWLIKLNDTLIINLSREFAELADKLDDLTNELKSKQQTEHQENGDNGPEL